MATWTGETLAAEGTVYYGFYVIKDDHSHTLVENPQAEYIAAENMTDLFNTVQNIKRHINPKLKIGGVFMTIANDTNFRKDIVASVKAKTSSHF